MLPVSATVAARARDVSLTPDDIRRFSRHLLLPQVGVQGQQRLKAARILIVGLGGLGAPVSLYLAAAGVGTLGLVDADTVDVSNLQRQILYADQDVGGSKLAATARRLGELAPAARLVLHEERLEAANAERILADYDIVVDGTDNFGTRYLINDACVLLGKPNVHGSIFRFDGQASVFYAPHGPCYRCLFPEPPSPELVPSCAEGGVLGVLPGQIGLVQATEALKLAIGEGEPLLGRLLVYDAMAMRFAEYRVGRDAACPACGTSPTIRTLSDLTWSCRTAPVAGSESSVPELDVSELRQWRTQGRPHVLVDVRSAEEVAICCISGSLLVPLGELAARLGELPRDRPLVVHCKSGARSARAVRLLQEQGFMQAVSLRGGILAWADACEPDLPRY